MEKDVEECR